MLRRSLLAAVLVLGLTAAGCGSSDESSSASGTLKVGVSPVPHGEILTYVKDNLAAKEGLKLDIVEFNDYVQPNVALQEKQLDANYFQHIPYLDEEVAAKGYKFTPLKPVHIEPLGLYSKTVKSIAEIPAGGTIGIPNDPSNSGRALALLAKNGLITLKDGVGVKATEKDITGNPKNLKFSALEAAQLPRSLEDTAASIVNGNYAIQTGLSPAKDALALEDGKDNPYANLVVVRTGEENDPRITKLETLLHSPEVKKFIEDKYQGSVLAAF
ncbi:MetQ/NlpA family ABC transporter substrate-binding protein [Actinoplanes sp. TFC3]|uniref:MetQ/NlpA family ABC transporter substrate-binding protein n=1 Tax=Actinoplanes sp. TFC3 TaxID=1710355 RepID=UPI000831AF2A|nr:MetQ/NlpA family ABC transporter substrate-binding protein [Actinoplanes sp. TFC3]